ncbi:hypothetical protein C0584_00945 [Candidatus Parcubacteria bacterium]|nr:MAG: hypothetical protein C0584_00945 [Candidatus Parcubacteria bacterium]
MLDSVFGKDTGRPIGNKDMNKISPLFDKKFVEPFFKEKIAPFYPEFSTIKKIKIIAHKKGVWGKKHYHVVLEYKTSFVKKEDGKTKTISIFCAAHDSEPRKNVHTVLKYLWKNSFSEGELLVPKPLFYSAKFRGTFYQGLEGSHLYSYIRKKDKKMVEEIIPQAAAWFAKLHSLPIKKAKNFNQENSRIKTVVPGVKNTYEIIKDRYPKYLYIYKKAYGHFIKKEESFLKRKNCDISLVHGDAHPENVIKISKKKIGVIDFADLCLSDPARDLGTFLQQLDYMAMRKIADRKYVNKIKKLFLDSYFKNANIEYTEGLQERIQMYYNWTLLRTATYFLLRVPSEPKRALVLLKQIKRRLNIKK